jgi:hypothetical protein
MNGFVGIGTVSPRQIREGLGDYIAKNGGPAGIARNGGVHGGSLAGQRVARNIGGFFSTVSSVGFERALREYGFGDLKGKSVQEIISNLQDKLGERSSSGDDADAVMAASDLFEEILKNAQTYEETEQILTDLCEEDKFCPLLMQYFGFYIYEQFVRVHYSLVVSKIGNEQAETFFVRIKDYIVEELKLRVPVHQVSKIDWNGQMGKSLIQSIHQQTLDVFCGDGL